MQELAPLRIPYLKTLSMDLKGSPAACREGISLHHHLVLRDDVLTGIARLAIARTAPEPQDVADW
jgi:hypothetical protein